MAEMKSLTCRELYDLVWSKPITKLAADFGISDVGLTKICGRYRVPSPPRTQRLETLIDSIAVGFDGLLAVRKAHRGEAEERQRKWEELSRRRDLKRRRVEREKDRLTYLNGMMALEREIEELRQWLTVARPTAETLPSSDFARLFNWTQQRLHVLAERVTPERVEADLQAKKLFPQTDDLDDPLGDPAEMGGWW